MAPGAVKPEAAQRETYVSAPMTGGNPARLDVTLRVLLFATTLIAVLMMVTSNETKRISVPGLPISVAVPAKFKHSPAFVYYVAALSIIGLYSIVSTFVSFTAISRPSNKKILHLALLDVVMLGLAASAAGAAGSIAYTGIKGNSHVNWAKICNTFDKFCRYVGVSIGFSLASGTCLLLLIMLSLCSLYSRLHRR